MPHGSRPLKLIGLGKVFGVFVDASAQSFKGLKVPHLWWWLGSMLDFTLCRTVESYGRLLNK